MEYVQQVIYQGLLSICHTFVDYDITLVIVVRFFVNLKRDFSLEDLDWVCKWAILEYYYYFFIENILEIVHC